jgi:4-aminobutyrate aminotransferase-like enzyme
MNTRQTLQCLGQYESRNVTFVEADGSWPIVWKRARGAHVWDAEGRRYLDLTAAFGVAAAGHANPAVVRAGQRQMAELLHAMGDVHPHAGKAGLARELSRITFERWPASKGAVATAKTIFCNSGFEAVEAALKTALLATGRSGVIAFQRAYHGLGYGALNATARGFFRDPFLSQLGRFGHFVPFPTRPDEVERAAESIRQAFRRHPAGALLIEPVQGRGGINVPPPAFLPLVRRLCDEASALLIADEIYTGFGRTGRWFACEHSGVVPDVICLGKAMTGGFPLSACVGRADIMNAAWPASTGEALHTSTFLGHPVGCAMALAQIREIRRRRLVHRSARLGRWLLQELATIGGSSVRVRAAARGLGLMAGLELRTREGRPATALALHLIKALLARGFILLPEGEDANVISLSPPLTIREPDLRRAVATLRQLLA